MSRCWVYKRAGTHNRVSIGSEEPGERGLNHCLLPLHHYLLLLLHHYTTTCCYSCTTTPLPAATPAPLHYYLLLPLHHYTTTCCYSCTTTPLPAATPAPLHYYLLLLLHHYTTTCCYPCTPAPLHYYLLPLLPLLLPGLLPCMGHPIKTTFTTTLQSPLYTTRIVFCLRVIQLWSTSIYKKK